MYADFKITIWERIIIPEDLEKEFVILAKTGKIYSVDSASILGNRILEKYELLLDTSSIIKPENNGGAPTIEIHSNENELKDKIIWDNGRKD